MGALFVSSGYAGWLGWQWRRTRTIGDEVKALKAQVPKVAVPAGGEGALEPAPSPLTQQIESLEKVRPSSKACMSLLCPWHTCPHRVVMER